MSITVCAFLYVCLGIFPPPENSMTATVDEQQQQQHLFLGIGFIQSRTKVIRCLNSVAQPESFVVIGSWSIIWDSRPKTIMTRRR